MNGRNSEFTTISYASRQSTVTTAGAEGITSEMVAAAIAAGHAAFANSAWKHGMIDAAFTPAITATPTFTEPSADVRITFFVC